MHQLGYINELLKKFNLEKCKPTKNLMPIESHELLNLMKHFTEAP